MLAGFGLISSRWAFAQQAATIPAKETPSATDQKADKQEASLQQIVVTGTLIHGTGPIGSTLITLDPANLQATGANTVIDMLRDVPQISSLGVSE